MNAIEKCIVERLYYGFFRRIALIDITRLVLFLIIRFKSRQCLTGLSGNFIIKKIRIYIGG